VAVCIPRAELVAAEVVGWRSTTIRPPLAEPKRIESLQNDTEGVGV